MKRIKELREAKGMSQQKLAIQLNVTQAVVSKYESGLSEPDISTIRKISDYFGVSADYLLEISNEKIRISSSGLTEEEKGVLFNFKRLDIIQREKLKAYLRGLLQE